MLKAWGMNSGGKQMEKKEVRRKEVHEEERMVYSNFL